MTVKVTVQKATAESKEEYTKMSMNCIQVKQFGVVVFVFVCIANLDCIYFIKKHQNSNIVKYYYNLKQL